MKNMGEDWYQAVVAGHNTPTGKTEAEWLRESVETHRQLHQVQRETAAIAEETISLQAGIIKNHEQSIAALQAAVAMMNEERSAFIVILRNLHAVAGLTPAPAIAALINS